MLGPARSVIVLRVVTGLVAGLGCVASGVGNQALWADPLPEKVARVLASRCLECHSGVEPKGGLDLTRLEHAKKGGETGPALVPGQLPESPLWLRVKQDEMPPKKPLAAEEKQILQEWIAAGAAWDQPIDLFQFTSEARAGYDWWSLRPIQRLDPPAVKDTAWPRQPLDHFVLAALEQQGLKPAAEAERRVLIRRLTYDLLGLPPTPEEVAAFEADRDPQAVERLVDRLLASPHYGERWARHWFDVIRFGESQGFERDKLRTNAWPYRDWVIQALNDDLPYDQFIRLQLAGDVLAPDDPWSVTATGFLVAGPFDEPGQAQQSLVMRAVVREDELEDIAAVVGQSFLGLTVNCARCHEHKFDPIGQRDYYQFTAALSGVRHGERDRGSSPAAPAVQARLEELDRQIGELTARRERALAPLREKLLAEKAGQQKPLEPPPPVARWEFDEGLNDSLLKLAGTAHGSAHLANGRLVLEGENSYVATAPLPFDLKSKTLEVWVAMSDLAQRGGAPLSIQTLDGQLFDAIVFGEQEPTRWMAGSNFFARTKSFQGPAETVQPPQLVQIVLAYDADGTIRGYRNGAPCGEPYQAGGVQEFAKDKAQIVFGLRHSPPGGNKHFRGQIERAALYDRALTPEECAATFGQPPVTVTEEEVLAQLPWGERQALIVASRELSHLQARRHLLSGGATYLNKPSQPELRRILARGNPQLPGEQVAPAAMRVGELPADLGLAADAPEAERRRHLADWMVDPKNPLTARVIMNRLWQHHFGQGLVNTPNDFGFNGGRPTHPELLDWLASELLAKRWSLKALHRQMVLSAAYRQSSRLTPEGMQADADNRFLWRKSPVRLEAEAVRDAVLSVAGQLNPTAGGPGYQDFRTFVFNSQFYEPIDAVGWQFNRRSVYRTLARSGTNPLLDTFDCPDPSTISPRRAVTTTPLQALSLLNDSFMLRMASALAARLEQERPGDVTQQIELAYRLAFARSPRAEEIPLAAAFVEQHKLAALCRVLLNANEFIYID